MENNQTTYQPKNTWKIAAIVLIAVVITLAGTTAIFAFKSNDAENSNSSKSNIASNEDYAKCPDTPTHGDKENNNSSKNYLFIKEWGVKFEIPYGLEDVTYKTKMLADGMIVELYTTLGDDTTIISNNDHAPFMDNALVTIVRFDANETDLGMSHTGVTIGNYHYAFAHPQAFYSYGDKVNETKEIIAFTLLWSAVHNLTTAQ
ncbi:hypothetical protein FWF74_00780 [Candidatus Saccharibacteria bacterium]|nr:hypothetical protein [Candidatus Saccharibacteria bacterium]